MSLPPRSCWLFSRPPRRDGALQAPRVLHASTVTFAAAAHTLRCRLLGSNTMGSKACMSRLQKEYKAILKESCCDPWLRWPLLCPPPLRPAG